MTRATAAKETITDLIRSLSDALAKQNCIVLCNIFYSYPVASNEES